MDGSFELAAGVFSAQKRRIDISEAVVRGRIVGTGSQVSFVVALSVRHVLLFGFEARERVNDGGVARRQHLRGVQSFVSLGKLVELEGLQSSVKLDIRCVGELFAGMAQGGKREIGVVVATAADGKLGGCGDFAFPGCDMMRVLREDGFEAIHGFGVAMLREQQLAGGKVGGDGVGGCRESVSEGLAGLFRLVKVEQGIAKEDQSGGVIGVLLGVWAKKRSGFGGLMLRVKMLGASNNGADLGLCRSLQSGEGQCEGQCEEKTGKAQTMHGIPL